ncbi:CLUMA_CG004088, isoform A [Clunio marinus]|uniref:CLUMA_CG004088, isoform A n=1 Tax=Clunio marinus TaxID=568069 RepID=A0A1J1HQP0_9DIPT|nr:CLUMA_CG004088, isoform A [Clunio marinus]
MLEKRRKSQIQRLNKSDGNLRQHQGKRTNRLCLYLCDASFILYNDDDDEDDEDALCSTDVFMFNAADLLQFLSFFLWFNFAETSEICNKDPNI